VTLLPAVILCGHRDAQKTHIPTAAKHKHSILKAKASGDAARPSVSLLMRFGAQPVSVLDEDNRISIGDVIAGRSFGSKHDAVRRISGRKRAYPGVIAASPTPDSRYIAVCSSSRIIRRSEPSGHP
jgi:hypothetical protein